MVIQSISSPSLNSSNNQKMNFTSTNTRQDSVSAPVNSSQSKEDDKKKAYRKGLITGVVISIIAAIADRLVEYLIKKSSPKIK